MFGKPSLDIDPVGAVLAEIGHAAGHVAYLRSAVQTLDAAAVEADSPWLTLYNSERDRLVRFSDLAVRLGIEVRRVQIAERTGGLVVGLLRGVLAELHLTPGAAGRRR